MSQPPLMIAVLGSDEAFSLFQGMIDGPVGSRFTVIKEPHRVQTETMHFVHITRELQTRSCTFNGLLRLSEPKSQRESTIVPVVDNGEIIQAPRKGHF